MNKYKSFNNYSDKTTLEVWKLPETGKYVIISTSVTKSLGKLNQMTSFKNYTNLRFLFDAEMVDSILAENALELISKYGQKLKMYVYK